MGFGAVTSEVSVEPVRQPPTCHPPTPWLSLQLQKDAERSQFMLYFSSRARLFKTAHFQDQDMKRMLSKLQNVDKSALPTEDLREVIDRAPGLQSTHSCTPGEGGSLTCDLEPECLGQ